jgi:hypothetical protein
MDRLYLQLVPYLGPNYKEIDQVGPYLLVGFEHTLGQSVIFAAKKGERLTGDWIMPPLLPWVPSLGYFRKTNPQNPGIKMYGGYYDI